ncbi:hypothetical protein NL676_031040 [Syzygium grande]|nr:hypothetical protein NL676_031040 [Syzygium grande]
MSFENIQLLIESYKVISIPSKRNIIHGLLHLQVCRALLCRRCCARFRSTIVPYVEVTTVCRLGVPDEARLLFNRPKGGIVDTLFLCPVESGRQVSRDRSKQVHQRPSVM